MSDERLNAPPPGAHICGGSWETMTTEARRELWAFHDRLAAKPSRKTFVSESAGHRAGSEDTNG